MKTCEICLTQFTPPKKNRPGRYCSARCRNTGNARASAAHRGDLQRGKGVVGYIKYNGRHQHRSVAEEMLGRPLLANEVVHHKDENKHNNHPDNLEILTRVGHMNAHGLGIPGKPLAHKPWEARWGK